MRTFFRSQIRRFVGFAIYQTCLAYVIILIETNAGIPPIKISSEQNLVTDAYQYLPVVVFRIHNQAMPGQIFRIYRPIELMPRYNLPVIDPLPPGGIPIVLSAHPSRNIGCNVKMCQ